MKINYQKIHDARTTRAINNFEKAFALKRKFGFLSTEKEKHLMEDIHPGLHAIMMMLNGNCIFIHN